MTATRYWLPFPRNADSDEQHGEAGEREHKVGEAHQQVVGPASVVAGERTDERADQRRQDRDKEGDALGGAGCRRAPG